MKKSEITIEQFANILKQNAIIEPAFTGIGGMEGAYNYSNAGVLFTNKFLDLWRKFFVNSEENVFLMDGPTINKRELLDKSGHTKTFFDYIIRNPESGLKHRCDKLIEDQFPKIEVVNTVNFYKNFFEKNNVIFKGDGENRVSHELEIEEEKLMFELNTLDLMRPETAQNIFADGLEIMKNNGKISGNFPLGIAQIGKGYRKEISGAQNSLFRRKEFYMAEIEYFSQSDEENDKSFEFWLEKQKEFFLEILGFSEENIRFRDLSKDDLAHYSKRTVDTEYKFPWGWMEIGGLANRGTYDMKNQHGREDLFVVEPTFGVDRILLAIIFENLEMFKDNEGNEHFKFNYPANLQAYDLAILPVVDSSKYNLAEHYKQLKKIIWDKYDFVFLDQNKGPMPKRMMQADLMGCKANIILDQDIGEELGSRLNDGTVKVRKNGAGKKEQEKVEFEKNKLINYLEEKIFRV
ncbi:hypothetical protein LR002_02815 [Candidatus Gracilibacteria bacterium]|nr:hypothetical protein [Candidatus Gracilibacteria bacterium]